MISRRSHQALKTPAYAGAPTERLKYAPSIPHCRPRTNTRPQMTIVEPRIRIPAWRSASPKNWSTRPEYTRPMVRPQKRAIAPSEASQSRGTASQPGIRETPSLDHLDLGVGGEQG